MIITIITIIITTMAATGRRAAAAARPCDLRARLRGGERADGQAGPRLYMVQAIFLCVHSSTRRSDLTSRWTDASVRWNRNT